jgi:SAM-dependent methyltransferase
MTQHKGYVDSQYLNRMAELLHQNKQQSYAWMDIRPGHRVLDVGCGPGTDTLPLAHLVGSMGQVVGVDADVAMITEAHHRATQAGVDSWVTHQQGDATALPFATASFDACRSERVFQHLLQPERALAEMVRVTKAGGWVVVLDTDWGSLSVDCVEVDIERRLARVKAEHCEHNGYAGRTLYRLFGAQGLGDVRVAVLATYLTDYLAMRFGSGADVTEREALRTGVITQAELDRWHASLERAAAAGQFFASIVSILVAGRTSEASSAAPRGEV